MDVIYLPLSVRSVTQDCINQAGVVAWHPEKVTRRRNSPHDRLQPKGWNNRRHLLKQGLNKVGPEKSLAAVGVAVPARECLRRYVIPHILVKLLMNPGGGCGARLRSARPSHVGKGLLLPSVRGVRPGLPGFPIRGTGRSAPASLERTVAAAAAAFLSPPLFPGRGGSLRILVCLT